MEQRNEFCINVLHAVRFIVKSWRNITSITISNCFKKCGFVVLFEEVPEVTFDRDVNLEADWDRFKNVDVRFEDFVSCDDRLANTGTLSDSEILNREHQTEENDNIDNNDPLDNEPQVSNRQAKEAPHTLRCYIEKSSNIADHAFGLLFDLEKVVNKEFLNSVTQANN